MQRIQLFIEGEEIQLDKQVNFAITKTFEDLNDPTVIINTWSKTVEIPGSIHNNAIFGALFRPDRVTVEGSGIGIYFDPTKKLDMKLFYNGSLLLQGYAKVNSVTNKNGNIKYNLTLNGQLGKIFQELQAITFDSAAPDMYRIDTNQYFSGTLDRWVIEKAWSWKRDQIVDLQTAMDDGNMYDFIGFTPNLSRVEDFDYASYQYSETNAKTFTETLDEHEAFKKLGMSADTALPNGMSPRGIGEFRSYHQLPYLYVNKLFQIFARKAEELTGYEWELDNQWFNLKNPYWKDLVMLLEPLTGNSGYSYINRYTMKIGDVTGGIYSNRFEWYKTTNKTESGEYACYPTLGTKMKGIYQPDMDKSAEVIEMYDVQTKEFTLPANYTFALLPEFELHIHNGNEHVADRGAIDKRCGLVVEFTIGSNTAKTLVVGPDTLISKSGYSQVITIPDFESKTSSSKDTYFDVPISLPIIETTSDTKVKLTVTSYWVLTGGYPSNLIPVRAYPSQGQLCTDGIQVTLDVKSTATAIAAIQDSQRSYTKFNMAKFWNEEFNLFSEVLRYCKVFGILIMTDDINKKLKFIHRAAYFNNHTIEDWTNKIDFTKDFTITPIVNDAKYMLFNYKDTEIGGNSSYKDSYGVNYGEYKLATNYNFDINTKNIMPEANTSITHTPNILSWSNLYDKGNLSYSVPAEYYVDCKGEDDKYTSSFGSYFFVSGGADLFDTNSKLAMRNVKITDDTPYMIVNNTYMYNQTGNDSVATPTYTSLRIDKATWDDTYFTNQPVTTYSLPARSYDYKRPFDKDAKGIYDIFWKEWLAERQSSQNKKITCYVDLTPTDYMNFEFNKFIKIGDMLYFVNKIYDYDVTTDSLTKVDLLQITNVSAYTSIPYYEYDKLSISFPRGYVDYKRGQQMTIATFESISPVTFSDGETFKRDDNLGIALTISGNKLQCATITAYSSPTDAIATYSFTNAFGNIVDFELTRYSVYPALKLTVTPSAIDRYYGEYTLSFSMSCGNTDDYTEEITDHPSIRVAYKNTNKGQLTFNNDWQTWYGEYYPSGPQGSSYITQEWYWSYKYTINTVESNEITFYITTKEGFTISKTINVSVSRPYPGTEQPVVTFKDLTGDLTPVNLPSIVRNGTEVVGFKQADDTVSTTSTLSNGSTLSLVGDKVVLTYNQMETGTPVDTTLGTKMYLHSVTGAAHAPGRDPVEIDYDELDTIGYEYIPTVDDSEQTVSLLSSILDNEQTISDVTIDDETEQLLNNILS